MSLSNIDGATLFLFNSEQNKLKNDKSQLTSSSSTQSQSNRFEFQQIKKQNAFYQRLQFIQKAQTSLHKSLTQIKDIGSFIVNADKLVRIFSSILKIIKNFELIQNLKKFDKLSFELGMTRRVFRLNRKYFLIKQLKSLVYNILINKDYLLTKIDIFNFFFKLFILISDLNDLISYLIQLKLIPNVDNKAFIKRTLNFYYFECIVWLGVHFFQYVKLQIQKRKHKYDLVNIKQSSQSQLTIKKLTIIKYICDVLTSHNDYSQKKWSLSPKNVSIFGMISSVLGIKIILK